MKTNNLLLIILATTLFQVCSQALSAEPETVDVPPIRRIVFFQSGVAQIFHEGEVSGNVRLKMTLPATEIEDALKSLIVEDEQGTVGGISYQVAPSPQDIAAANFPPMSLAQILQKYRGQKISFSSDGKPISGKIIGVEKRIRTDHPYEALVILNQDGLMAYVMDEISSVKFSDEDLRKEIDNALLGLAKPDAESTRSLFIASNCDGD